MLRPRGRRYVPSTTGGRCRAPRGGGRSSALATVTDSPSELQSAVAPARSFPEVGGERMSGSELTVVIGAIALAADLAIRIAALIVIPRERKPSSAMAWLLAIFLIPFVGILFFLLLGSPKLPRARRAKQTRITEMIAEAVRELPPGTLLQRATWPTWFSSLVHMNESLS